MCEDLIPDSKPKPEIKSKTERPPIPFKRKFSKQQLQPYSPKPIIHDNGEFLDPHEMEQDKDLRPLAKHPRRRMIREEI